MNLTSADFTYFYYPRNWFKVNLLFLTSECPSKPGLDNLYLRHMEDYLVRLMRRERLSPKWTELIRNFCNKIVNNIELEPVLDPDLKVWAKEDCGKS